MNHDVCYIARTNEEGPPIKCEFLRYEYHENSGGSIPVFAKEVTPGHFEEFLFMGPVILYDEELFQTLSRLSGKDGYDWLCARLDY